MATKVVMPKLGTGMNEGTVLRWLKSEGDAVTEGEPIAEIETTKAVEEMEAPGSGILLKILRCCHSGSECAMPEARNVLGAAEAPGSSAPGPPRCRAPTAAR